MFNNKDMQTICLLGIKEYAKDANGKNTIMDTLEFFNEYSRNTYNKVLFQ